MTRRVGALVPLLAMTVVTAAEAAAQQTVRLPAQDNLLRDRPTPEFTIGAEEGESWELLAGVRQIAFDRNENLYILDANNHRVLVFNASGRFVRQIGKKGEGPGELMLPLAMAVTGDNQVVVSDLGRRAYSVFRSDGTFVRNVTVSDEISAFTQLLHPHPRGVVTRTMPTLRLGEMRAAAGSTPALPDLSGPQKSAVVVTDLGTASQNPIWEMMLPSTNPRIERQQTASGGAAVRVMSMTAEFTPPVLFGVVPDGSVAVASEADYRIRVVNSGNVQRIIERPIPPRKVGKREQDLAREQRRASLSGNNPGVGTAGVTRVAVNMSARAGQGTSISTSPPPAMTPAQIEEQLAAMQFMDYVPVLRRMTTDPSGRLWIQRTAADLGDSGPVDIVTLDGRYIGTIANGRAPDAVSPGGRAAWVERDELGVERVAVRRLPATWR